MDPVWERPALTQPQAIKVVADFAKEIGAAKLFDAGDVQANGFQVVEDDQTGDTFTESGASYMGFAASALLATALCDKPRYTIAFTGDGSFMMNPQILIDGVEHGVRGMIVIFDNRRMAAISGLQLAQYQNEHRTSDGVAVDYVQLAGAVHGVKAVHGGWDKTDLRRALEQAHAYAGLSFVHVPVYFGEEPLASMGAWGAWNVGNWCDAVQRSGWSKTSEAWMYRYKEFGLYIGGRWSAALIRQRGMCPVSFRMRPHSMLIVRSPLRKSDSRPGETRDVGAHQQIATSS